MVSFPAGVGLDFDGGFPTKGFTDAQPHGLACREPEQQGVVAQHINLKDLLGRDAAPIASVSAPSGEFQAVGVEPRPGTEQSGRAKREGTAEERPWTVRSPQREGMTGCGLYSRNVTRARAEIQDKRPRVPVMSRLPRPQVSSVTYCDGGTP